MSWATNSETPVCQRVQVYRNHFRALVNLVGDQVNYNQGFQSTSRRSFCDRSGDPGFPEDFSDDRYHFRRSKRLPGPTNPSHPRLRRLTRHTRGKLRLQQPEDILILRHCSCGDGSSTREGRECFAQKTPSHCRLAHTTRPRYISLHMPVISRCPLVAPLIGLLLPRMDTARAVLKPDPNVTRRCTLQSSMLKELIVIRYALVACLATDRETEGQSRCSMARHCRVTYMWIEVVRDQHID